MPVSPPIRNFLHLNAFRAFEAAARLGGFAQAGDELLVSAGAVSAQIKLLEKEYGAQLFERNAKGVKLTALGESLQPEFTTAFDTIEAAARSLRRQAAPQKVCVVTSPALAELWLAPRLHEISEKSGGAQISIAVLEEPPNLKRSPYDICLFYTSSVTKGKTRLYDEFLLPVCEPSLAKNLNHPRDLMAMRCISDVVWDDWRIWAGSTLPGIGFAANGPGYSLYSIAVQQALQGVGVLIGRQNLIQPFLDKGALVAPFEERVPLGLAVTAWALPDSKGSLAVKNTLQALISSV